MLELLKQLLPSIKITELIREFEEQYKLTSDIFETNITINYSREQTPSQKKKGSSLENNGLASKEKKILGGITIVLILLLTAFIAGKSYFSINDESTSTEPIRSELVIPAESAFLKRPKLIAAIEKKFQSQKSTSSIAVVGIVGLAGSGKTMLSHYYGRSQSFPVIWEMNAETKETLLNSLKKLAYALAQTQAQKDELEFVQNIQISQEREEQLVAFVKKYLKRRQNWMLIYDNVEQFHDIKNYFPNDPTVWGAGNVIITTTDDNIQNTTYINPDQVLRIDALTEEESLMLFSRIIHNSDSNSQSPEQKEKSLVFLTKIPPFPLDVSMAARYIENTKITYEQYLERISSQGNNYFDISTNKILEGVGCYNKTRYGIISSSFKKLDEMHPDFKELLLFICLLESQQIPRKLLSFYRDDSTVEQFMYELKKYSFIVDTSPRGVSHEEKTFSIHRSIQTVGLKYLLGVISWQDQRIFIDKFILAIDCFYKKYPKEDYKAALLLMPHVEVFLNNLQAIGLSANEKGKYVAKLHLILGHSHLKYSNNLMMAKKYFLQVYDKKKDVDENTLATLLKDLGNICLDLYEFDEGLLYCQESIRICKKFKDNQYLLAENLLIMGYIYALKNDFLKSNDILNQALRTLESSNHNLKDELVARIYGALSFLYSTTYINGPKSHKAMDYIARALETVNGSRSFYKMPKPTEKLSWLVARYKRTLGQTYCRLGQYKEALIKGFRESEYIIDHNFDTCSHKFLKIRLGFGMGEVFLREGNLKLAEEKLTGAIRESYRLVGESDTVVSKILRAETLIRLGRLKEAYEDCESVLSVVKLGRKSRTNYAILGHLTCLYHAAFIKYKQHDFEKSLRHFTDFFNNMKAFCKGFLDKGDYKELEEKGVFAVDLYESKNTEKDIKKYLKNSIDIFTAIYDSSHPFVKNYIVPNYNEMPWYVFWRK
jgi:tetratricopeptide (TPR) repeat protein